MNALRSPIHAAPPRGPRHLVKRPRLTEALLGARDQRVVTLIAPAGYGKTSLLVDVASEIDPPLCWLTVEEWLRDPVELIDALATAVDRAVPGTSINVRRALTGATAETARVRLGIAALIERLVAPDGGLLIFDDVHRLGEDGPAVEALGLLLDHLPAGWCTLLAGRRLPTIPGLPRLALDGEVGRLLIEQLALTRDETALLAGALSTVPLSKEAAERLWRETGGWPAAVVLRCQGSAIANAAPVRGVRDLSPAAVVPLNVELFDYLARDVFAELATDERNLLMRAAVPRVLDDDAFSRVVQVECGEPLAVDKRRGATSLVQLVRRHAFITPLADTRSGTAGESYHQYRLHDLFRDFLLAEARAVAPASIAALHEAVGELCEARDNPLDAAYHFRMAESWSRLTSVAVALVRRRRNEGRWRAIGELIGGLPEPARALDPSLVIYHAEADCNLGEPDVALERLAMLWPTLQSGERRAAHAQALIVRGLARRLCGSHAAAIADSRAAEQILIEANADSTLIAHARRLLGIALASSGDSAAALPILEQAASAFEATGEIREQAVAHDSVAAALLQLGHAAEAATHLERARRGWSRLENSNALALTLNNLGVAYTLLGDLELAEDVLCEAQRRADASDNERSTSAPAWRAPMCCASVTMGRRCSLSPRRRSIDRGPATIPSTSPTRSSCWPTPTGSQARWTGRRRWRVKRSASPPSSPGVSSRAQRSSR